VFASLALIHHFGGPVGFPGFGFLFFLIPLFWIAVIALIAGLGRRRWRRTWAMNGGHPGFGGWGAARGAESTLAERFANGDIDEKEYRARLEVLRANRQ
jgi:putative membrane protein